MPTNNAFAATQETNGISCLASESSRALDWHEESHARTLRGLSVFAGALILALAIVLLLLGASAARAAGLI